MSGKLVEDVLCECGASMELTAFGRFGYSHEYIYICRQCDHEIRLQLADRGRLILVAAQRDGLLVALKQARDFYRNAGSLERFADGFDIDTVEAAIAKVTQEDPGGDQSA